MSVLTPPLGHGGRLRRVWGLHVSLRHGGGGGVWSPLGSSRPLFNDFQADTDALRRGVKPVRTPVAILGSLGVCIYVPASRHWLISYSPIHLT